MRGGRHRPWQIAPTEASIVAAPARMGLRVSDTGPAAASGTGGRLRRRGKPNATRIAADCARDSAIDPTQLPLLSKGILICTSRSRAMRPRPSSERSWPRQPPSSTPAGRHRSRPVPRLQPTPPRSARGLLLLLGYPFDRNSLNRQRLCEATRRGWRIGSSCALAFCQTETLSSKPGICASSSAQVEGGIARLASARPSRGTSRRASLDPHRWRRRARAIRLPSTSRERHPPWIRWITLFCSRLSSCAPTASPSSQPNRSGSLAADERTRERRLLRTALP